MDLFFRELSYEVIAQKEAFNMLSLLGEVGGFMGLLLGASILTLCELIDYIAILCLKRCHTKKMKKNQTQPMPTPESTNQKPYMGNKKVKQAGENNIASTV